MQKWAENIKKVQEHTNLAIVAAKYQSIDRHQELKSDAYQGEFI